MNIEFPGKTVVVTGGSRGIGRAICIALAGPKTRIFFNYFSPVDPEGEAAAAAETIKAVADAGGEAVGMSVDVASAEEVQRFFEEVLKVSGRIDVLINNAGIAGPTARRVRDQEGDEAPIGGAFSLRHDDGSLTADDGATAKTRFEAVNEGWVSITRPWHPT